MRRRLPMHIGTELLDVNKVILGRSEHTCNKNLLRCLSASWEFQTVAPHADGRMYEITTLRK